MTFRAGLFLIFLLFAPCAFAADSNTGIEWHEVDGNPALVPDSCFSWRCAGAGDPTIARAKDGSLLLWFTTMGIHLSITGFQADGPWVGRTTADKSLRLKVSPEDFAVVPVGFEGTWDRYVETPTVRLTGDHWTMWYLGYSGRGGGKSGFENPALGQMMSFDAEGETWKHPALPIYRPMPDAWDGDLVTGPTVVLGPDKIWRLYYTGIGKKEGIGLLTSRDGTNWAPYAGNPVLEADPDAWDQKILEQAVAYFNGKYWLWYSGYREPLDDKTNISIGVATSGDGIHWTRYAGNPVIKPGPPGSWNELRVLAPDVIIEPDGSLLMAAYGMSTKDPGKSAGSIGFWRSK